MNVDLNNVTFESFVAFLFEHPVANKWLNEEPWYYDAEISFDPSHIVDLYIRLFVSPAFLLERYSHEELEQGFWAAQTCLLDCSASELVWESDVELALREEMIRSMFFLYEQVFSQDPLETSSNMWWDSLAYGYCCGNFFRERSEEERRIQDAMFETLSKMLDLDSEACQIAALHGLGHLQHPHTEAVIRSYLAARPELELEIKEYALEAIAGDVM